MILLTTLNSKYIQTSLALYTLKAYCRREFPDLSVLEFNINQDLDWILAQIYQTKPAVVGLSTNIWNITLQLELVNRLKKLRPETVIILGGPEVSTDPQEIMEEEPGIDYIVRGEGEETLLELLRYLAHGVGKVSQIAGLAYREGSRIQITPSRAPLPDLAVIPFPYEDLSLFKNKLVYYESSRGCVFNCAYCLSGWEEGRVRSLPVDRVKADLARFVQAGIKTVKFVDRTFNFHWERALEILRYIKEEGGDTEFHLELVGELLGEEEIQVLNSAPSGRFRVEIGVQSTCLPTLREIGRFHNLEKLKKNVSKLTAAGRITTHLDLIAGLPYEDLAGLAQSFNFTFRLHSDELQLGFLKLLKGSPLRTRASEYGYEFTKAPPYEILTNKWLSFEDLIQVKVIEDLVERFYNSHYFRNTLRYIFRGELPLPWDFFRLLGSYWEEQRLTGRSLKLADLFDYFFLFLQSAKSVLGIGHHEWSALIDLLTLDFHLLQRGGAGPSWLRREDSALRERIQQAVVTPKVRGEQGIAKKARGGRGLEPGEIPLPDWKRRVKAFTFTVDPESGAEEKTIVLVHTPTVGSSLWCKFPVDSVEEW
ncbi:MAG TPA: B12-binding domain-containing radical SAM protein [Firmicutes bacterium]|nr:B12-binding domain-containing radical SAM protein [Bacillota bacterium]